MQVRSGWCLSHADCLKNSSFSPTNCLEMSIWKWRKWRSMVRGDIPLFLTPCPLWGLLREGCGVTIPSALGQYLCYLKERSGVSAGLLLQPSQDVPRKSCFSSSLIFQIDVILGKLANPPPLLRAARLFCVFWSFFILVSFFSILDAGLFIYWFISAWGVDLVIFIGFVVGWWELFCKQNF